VWIIHKELYSTAIQINKIGQILLVVSSSENPSPTSILSSSSDLALGDDPQHLF
jgi:hypothetical protein